MLETCTDATLHAVPGIRHSHSFITNTDQAVNETVRQTDGCDETVTQGFGGGTTPNYDYVEAFFDRAFAARETEPPVATAELSSESITSQDWYVKAVVTLEAEDLPSWGSGVATTEYRINDGQVPIRPPSTGHRHRAPILIDGETGEILRSAGPYPLRELLGNEHDGDSPSGTLCSSSRLGWCTNHGAEEESNGDGRKDEEEIDLSRRRPGSGLGGRHFGDGRADGSRSVDE